MPAVLVIFRQQLLVVVKTWRIGIFAALYGAFALVGGLAYLMSLRFAEKQAIRLLVDNGASPAQAASAISLGSEKAYQQLVAWLAGVTDIAQVAPSIKESLVLPAFLWGSLAFLPLLVVLVSFDHLAAELNSRSICFTVVRVSRRSFLAGKLLAQATLFAALTAVASLALVGLAAIMLQSFSTASALPGLLRLWLLLLPYGLAYLALASFCSASTKEPTLALVMAIGAMIGLRTLGWLRHIPTGHSLSFLRHLHWLSPATYQDGLWQSGLRGPLTSVAAYLAFAAVFTLLADLRLARRDL